MLEFAMNFAITSIYTAILYKILTKILTPKKPFWIKAVFLLGLWYSCTIFIYPDELTGCIGTLFGLLLLVFFCCTNKAVIKLSVIFIFYPLIITINFMTEDIGFQIWQHIFRMNMDSPFQTLLHSSATALRIPIWYCIYILTRKWMNQFVHLTKKMWYAIDSICMTSFIGIMTIIYNSNTNTAYITYPACIACIVTSLGVCYLCAYISQTMYAMLETQTLKHQQTYYEELDSNQQKTCKLKHDMQNHLNIIQTLLQNQEFDQAVTYLSELSGEFLDTLHVFCQNSIVNSVLNTKYTLAADHDINCRLRIELDEEISIDNVSLCSLLANTLDNAIDACKQIQNPLNRSITVNLRCLNGFFSYEITNTKENEIIEKRGNIQTGKADKSLHGYGLQNINDVVSRYGGNIDITYTDNNFSVIVLIPTPSFV